MSEKQGELAGQVKLIDLKSVRVWVRETLEYSFFPPHKLQIARWPSSPSVIIPRYNDPFNELKLEGIGKWIAGTRGVEHELIYSLSKWKMPSEWKHVQFDSVSVKNGSRLFLLWWIKSNGSTGRKYHMVWIDGEVLGQMVPFWTPTTTQNWKQILCFSQIHPKKMIESYSPRWIMRETPRMNVNKNLTSNGSQEYYLARERE